MMGVRGHLYQVAWINPYTNPPDGRPRVLAGYFIPTAGACPRAPEAITAVIAPGSGYSLIVCALSDPVRLQSPERLASQRKRNLRQRIESKTPMFAEQFIAAEMERKPEYYAGAGTYDDEKIAIINDYTRALAFWECHPLQVIYHSEMP